MKCYLIRHQKAGVVTSHVFTSAPTAEQVAPVLADLAKRHDPNSWHTIVEAELFGPGEVPVFAPAVEHAPGLVEQILGLGDFKFDGVGHVENPKR
jgi:hypothetical protein